MDPASSTLTFLGAGITLAKGIERIREARKYPKECSRLFNETVALKYALGKCYALAESVNNDEESCKQFRILEHATAARNSLQERQNLLMKDSSSNRSSFWTALVRDKQRVTWRQEELRRIRDALNISLAVFAA